MTARRHVLAALALAAMEARAARWVIRAGQEAEVKALLGPAWGGTTAGYRVVSGRVDRTTALITLEREGREATLRLDHPDASPAGDDVVTGPGLAVTLRCPGCAAP